MRHPKVNVEALRRALTKAAGGRSPTAIAEVTGVHISRVGRFLAGDFKKLTPVLRQFSKRIGVDAGHFELNAPASGLPPELLSTLRRIVGRDHRRAAAAGRLFRSLESLTNGPGVRGSGKGQL